MGTSAWGFDAIASTTLSLSTVASPGAGHALQVLCASGLHSCQALTPRLQLELQTEAQSEARTATRGLHGASAGLCRQWITRAANARSAAVRPIYG